MKLALAALVVLLASACVSTTDRYGYRDRAYYPASGNVYGASRPQGEYLICHKGKKTLSLPASAIDAHMGHGDRRGPC